MFNSGHIPPKWNIEDFETLNYKADIHKDIALIDQYENSGHYRPSMSLYNYFQPSPMPAVVFDYIVPQFDLAHVSVAINHFKPGQYLPMHTDLFGKYSQIHQLQNQEITRIIVMLQHSQPGQISQVHNRTMGEWQAGDWFQWDAEDAHAFYNFSMHNRYAVQLTGTKNQKSLFSR